MRNRVRELRTQVGMTQANLGDALGVSRQTINSIEAGRYLPSLPLALKIGRLFGSPVHEIFEMDEEDG
ncbi:MAG TPA: helix-turn-helix transcriptional regulator [Actinomycetota bacterium]|nr:helix-turn-helix transcriptional regulator [Actinomycetota bacterium]